MLLYEQYFMIYLFGIFLIKEVDLKLLFSFIVVDYLIDNTIYKILLSPIEYIIVITAIESIGLLFIIPFIRDIATRLVFSSCFILTVINPYFLLSIDYFITRDDVFTYYLFIFCSNSSYCANEIFIGYLLHRLDKSNIKTNFWITFTICNYLILIATYLKEI